MQQLLAPLVVQPGLAASPRSCGPAATAGRRRRAAAGCSSSWPALRRPLARQARIALQQHAAASARSAGRARSRWPAAPACRSSPGCASRSSRQSRSRILSSPAVPATPKPAARDALVVPQLAAVHVGHGGMREQQLPGGEARLRMPGVTSDARAKESDLEAELLRPPPCAWPRDVPPLGAQLGMRAMVAREVRWRVAGSATGATPRRRAPASARSSGASGASPVLLHRQHRVAAGGGAAGQPRRDRARGHTAAHSASSRAQGTSRSIVQWKLCGLTTCTSTTATAEAQGQPGQRADQPSRPRLRRPPPPGSAARVRPRCGSRPNSLRRASTCALKLAATPNRPMRDGHRLQPVGDGEAAVEDAQRRARAASCAEANSSRSAVAGLACASVAHARLHVRRVGAGRQPQRQVVDARSPVRRSKSRCVDQRWRRSGARSRARRPRRRTRWSPGAARSSGSGCPRRAPYRSTIASLT